MEFIPARPLGPEHASRIASHHAEGAQLARGDAETGSGPPPGPDIADALHQVTRLAWEARRLANVGNELPPMHRQEGPRRAVAKAVGQTFLTAGRFVFREQRQFNHEVLTVLDRLAQAASALASRQAFAERALWTAPLAKAAALADLEVRLSAELDQHRRRHEQVFASFDQRLGAIDQRIEALGARLEAHVSSLGPILAEQNRATSQRLAAVESSWARASVVISELREAALELRRSSDAGLATTRAEISRLDAAIARVRETSEVALASIRSEAEVMYAQGSDDLSRVRDQILQDIRAVQEQLARDAGTLPRAAAERLDAAIEQAGVAQEALSKRMAALQVSVEVEQASLDSLQGQLVATSRALSGEIKDRTAALEPMPIDYSEFEARFRGGKDLILARLRRYLPVVHGLVAPRPGVPWLDLGCGRGEWLDVLADAGYVAYGVDSNESQLVHARAAGADVRKGDLFDVLENAETESHLGLSLFQVVEHLSYGQIHRLLGAAHRVLHHGGVLLIETPNPENVTVSTHTFHLDPTHRHILPPSLLQFLLDQAGFRDIQLLRLNDEYESGLSVPPGLPAELELSLRRLNALFYGPRDYALVALK